MISKTQSLKNLEDEVNDVLYDLDKNVLKIIVASIVANYLPKFPVWIMLVAGPSTGKSEVMQIFSTVDHVHSISDLTVNTFASGMKKKGEETSLLHRVTNGILFFKDFTTILSKRSDDRHAIMGQMREIYDGKYDKETGNGERIHWEGKIGAVAGVTESVYQFTDDMSAMGNRFIMYSMYAPERKAVTRYLSNNDGKVKEMASTLQATAKEYVASVIASINVLEDGEIDPELHELLIDTADLATRVRSAVITDFKSGIVDFVPAPEMPMRMMNQLMALASGFQIIRKHDTGESKITDEEVKLLMKIAFDSVPRTRRDMLSPLAIYTLGCTTAGLATYLSLPTDTVRKYLSHINALGVCDRIKISSNKDKYIMKPEYANIVRLLYGLEEDRFNILEGTEEEEEKEIPHDDEPVVLTKEFEQF